MAMTHPSKRKGDGFEREFVNEAQHNGIAAERAYGRGRIEVNGFNYDISCPVLGQDWKIECKRRPVSSGEMYRLLRNPNIHAVVTRADNEEAQITFRLKDFWKLAKGGMNV